MVFLILLLYIILFGYWIKHSSFFGTIDLARPLLFFIFMTKIGVGFLYALIHHTYFEGGDTFFYFNDAVVISDTFFEHPLYYIQSLIGIHPPPPIGTEVFLYPDAAIFWKDLGTYTIVHIHAIINLFAFDSYELHLFFIAIISFYASLNFYKVFEDCLELPKTILIAACFFLPSITFWTAGVHKEAYIYLGLSLFISGLYNFQTIGWSKSNLIKFTAGILLIGIIRHYLLALLIPATLGYTLSILYPKQKIWQLYLGTYAVCTLVGSGIAQLVLGLDLLDILANQQALFFSEKGGSTIPDVTPISANFWSIFSMIPIAITNALGRPFLWECKDFLQIIAAIEILCFSGLSIAAFLFKKPNQKTTNPLVHFIIAYAISNLLLIGLLVINVGTIARYRSISLGLLSILLTQILDFYKLGLKKTETPIRDISHSKLKNISKPSSSPREITS